MPPKLGRGLLTRYSKDLCFVYLNDILIFSPSLEDNKRHVQVVVETLAKAGIELNSPLKDKVAPVLDMQCPSTYKELRRLLGTINYY